MQDHVLLGAFGGLAKTAGIAPGSDCVGETLCNHGGVIEAVGGSTLLFLIDGFEKCEFEGA